MIRRYSYDETDTFSNGHDIPPPQEDTRDNIIISRDTRFALDALQIVDDTQLKTTQQSSNCWRIKDNTHFTSMPPEGLKSDDLKLLPLHDLTMHIRQMHPQFAAFLLSRLPRQIASDILSFLPENSVSDIFARIIAIKKPAPIVAELIENTLLPEISETGKPGRFQNDDDFLDMLYEMPAASQSEFIEHLHTNQSGVFLNRVERNNLNKLAALPRYKIHTLFQKIERKTILKALSGDKSDARETFLRSLSPQSRANTEVDIVNHIPVSTPARIRAQCALISIAIAMTAEPNGHSAVSREPLAELLIED